MKTITKTLTNTLFAVATASLFSFSAMAEESAVTHAQAQQIRGAAISIEQQLDVMMVSIDHENETQIIAMTHTSLDEMDNEAELSVESNETMIAE
ncbi:hypothetical protein AADZ86_02220 [Colwelliaceae bacterium BS250]